jgi:hypothetical protein
MTGDAGLLKVSDLGFEDVLPHVVTFYRKGVLSPFIGSGMSLPTCTTWIALLRKLAEETGVPVPPALSSGQTVPSTTLYRLADLTVSALRPLRYDERAVKYQNALCNWSPGERPVPPPQTSALARLSWPLVLTTNYDDLFWCATPPGSRPEIVGRQLEDCHRVLRSLDESSPPVLWALQGFLGGQAQAPENILPDPRRRLDLANQIVVGHQQYQRAVNAEAHFRRAFAEVFRRRSLLFLGSGLLEDYLVNLFGEIIHHHGPGPYPHFALLNKNERERFDPWFLQTRLGIVPVFYSSHTELPGYLESLAALAKVRTSRSQPGPVTAELQQLSFDLSMAAVGGAPLRIEICNSTVALPDPAGGECSVVSVGRDADNTPLEGRQAGGHLEAARKAGIVPEDGAVDWVPLDEVPSYCYRYGTTPVFGVAARRRDLPGAEHDRRHLGIIPDAIYTILNQIDALGFKTVRMGPIASGKLAPWHPVHPFAQVLRGIRRFAVEREGRNLNRISLCLVDPKVWLPVLANKIPLLELISSDLATHRVDVRDSDGGIESFSVTLRESPSLGALLRFCNIDRRKWKVAILPSPTGEDRQEPEDDTVIVPTMTVSLVPRGL